MLETDQIEQIDASSFANQHNNDFIKFQILKKVKSKAMKEQTITLLLSKKKNIVEQNKKPFNHDYCDSVCTHYPLNEKVYDDILDILKNLISL